MDQPLANTKHERFASIVAYGKCTQGEAYVQAGYAEKGSQQAACALVKNPLVASRIKWFQDRQAADVQATSRITRERIANELAGIAFNGHAPMVRMKAMELLVKLQGYAEPSRTEVSHMHLHIDSGLAAQLREGYAQLKLSPDKWQASGKPTVSNRVEPNDCKLMHDASARDVAPVVEVKHQAHDVSCATIDDTAGTPPPPVPSTQRSACPPPPPPPAHTGANIEEGI